MKYLKNKKKIKKKIMKSAMGNLGIFFTTCSHSTSTPDKQLNRQVFYFIFFFLRMMRCLGGGAVT